MLNHPDIGFDSYEYDLKDLLCILQASMVERGHQESGEEMGYQGNGESQVLQELEKRVKEVRLHVYQ